MGGDGPDWEALRQAAVAASQRSYSPYSHFAVGAAGLCRDGTVLSGTNVENASYPVGICAETALLAVLVASGRTRGDLVAVSVCSPDGTVLVPCGSCRQFLHEMGGPELLVDGRPIGELLPDAFGPDDLGVE